MRRIQGPFEESALDSDSGQAEAKCLLCSCLMKSSASVQFTGTYWESAVMTECVRANQTAKAAS